MERIQGQDLATAWKNLSKESLQKSLSHLKDMVQQLRSLEPPPNTGVESCGGGSLYDSRLPHGNPRFGPFKIVREFHRWLRGNLQVAQIGSHLTKQEAEEIKAMIARQDGPWPGPVFTYCDLNPSKILIRGDKIIGIIDWEFTGWYAPYWEYTSAWLGNLT